MIGERPDVHFDATESRVEEVPDHGDAEASVGGCVGVAGGDAHGALQAGGRAMGNQVRLKFKMMADGRWHALSLLEKKISESRSSRSSMMVGDWYYKQQRTNNNVNTRKTNHHRHQQ